MFGAFSPSNPFLFVPHPGLRRPHEPGVATLENRLRQFAARFGIWCCDGIGGAPGLSARRSRPPTSRPARVLGSAQVDDRERPATEKDLVSRSGQALHEDRSETPPLACRMAHSFRQVLAVPGRLPLGCERKSLYLSHVCPEEGQGADERISARTTSTGR
jgi:hypothetical protein